MINIEIFVEDGVYDRLEGIPPLYMLYGPVRAHTYLYKI